MADPVNPNEVPKDFFCAVCLSVPVVPWIVEPCSHIFCRKCISDSLNYKELCPVCQQSCERDQVHPLKTKNCLANRIWSNIVVECRHHTNNCGWTGPIAEYQSHKQCSPTIEVKNSKHKCCGWTGSITDFQAHLRCCNVAIEHDQLETQVKKLSESAQRLEMELEEKDAVMTKMRFELQTLKIELEAKERKICHLSRLLSFRFRSCFGFRKTTNSSDASSTSSTSSKVQQNNDLD